MFKLLTRKPPQGTVGVVKSGQHHRNSYRTVCPCRQEGAKLAERAKVVETTSYSVADAILYGDIYIDNQAQFSNSGRESYV